MDSKFELECSLYDLGKIFDVKHNNMHNKAFIYIISKVRSKREVRFINFFNEKIFVINIDSNIDDREYEAFREYFATLEREIKDEFSSEYQIKLYRQ